MTTVRRIGAAVLASLCGLIAVAPTAGALAATHFSVAAPSLATAGVPFTVTVTAQDITNATDTAYAGTVTLSSSDPAAILPQAYTFKASDHGARTFTVTLNTPGQQTITATSGDTP